MSQREVYVEEFSFAKPERQRFSFLCVRRKIRVSFFGWVDNACNFTMKRAHCRLATKEVARNVDKRYIKQDVHIHIQCFPIMP